MTPEASIALVESFWKEVWAACNPAAIDRFVTDDFIITTATLGHRRLISARVSKPFRPGRPIELSITTVKIAARIGIVFCSPWSLEIS